MEDLVATKLFPEIFSLLPSLGATLVARDELG